MKLQGQSDEQWRAEQFRVLQNRALELAAENRPLHDALDDLMQAVEAQSSSSVKGSILLLDEEGSHLLHGAAPSLPDAYNAAIDGIAVGSGIGSCGTAAFENRPVYVSDIAIDPLWADFRELALSHNLRACWSTPIVSAEGAVLGTFAMYYAEPREPSPADPGDCQRSSPVPRRLWSSGSGRARRLPQAKSGCGSLSTMPISASGTSTWSTTA